MRWGTKPLAGAAALLTVVVLAGTSPLRGDEPGLLGRLFRMGGGGRSSAEPTRDPDLHTPGPAPREALTPMPGGSGEVVRESSGVVPMPAPAGPAGAGPRIVPHDRVSRPVTDADPLVTRVSLGRSNDGHQFGMFLQVYADGTVIDSEGVHPMGREAVRGLVAALEATDFARVRHCGGPPTDFVESVQMVVFDRSFGRLRATSFSFSGNVQGCDPAVRRLQAALDALQNRVSTPAGSIAAPPGQPAPGVTPVPAAAPGVMPMPVAGSPDVTPFPASGAPPVIPLPAPAAPAPVLGPLPAGPGVPLTGPSAAAPPIRLNEDGPAR